MFTLKIKTENEAFNYPTEGERDEVARILRALATRLEQGSEVRGLLADLNGNTVGEWKLTR